jgi:putative selenium metabolism hydrolase
MPDPQLVGLVQGARERIVSFCQRALQTPSLSGEEEALAQLTLRELTALGLEARIDGAGNVVAALPGGAGATTLLHAHLDIVTPGELSLWKHPPFFGDIAEGHLWGRGAVDDKGCLAAQVYALGLLREAGIVPAGVVYLAAVVGEETGGLGTRHLAETLRPDVAVVGEPSSNTLRRGHRGRFEFIVTWHGRAGHASAPARALNPLYSLAAFLLALRAEPLTREATFGGSSVAPTLLRVDQTSANVIPAEVMVHLDWRNAPGETVAQARAVVEGLVARTLDPGVSATVQLRQRLLRTYTDVEQVVDHAMPAFLLAADDARVVAAQGILERALGRAMPPRVWTFTTDGGLLAEAGIPCLGFGPGEENMAHVADERLAIDELLEATVAYMALARDLGRATPLTHL